MPGDKRGSIKTAELRQAYKTDLITCWEHARLLHPNHRPYAFVLHGLEGTPHLYPYVLTEESLTQVATRYLAEGYHETLEDARKALRYSVEDSPHAAELEGKLPTVDALVEPTEEALEETEGYALLATAAMEAFGALDKQGSFGGGKSREKLLLMIDTGLARKDWSIPSVKRLNSASAFRRYQAETKIEGVRASADALAFSPDGRVCYFAGTREIDPRKETSVSELVACEVAGLRLKRRWNISAPWKSGVPIRSLACARDGTLFVLGALFEAGESSKTILTCFPRGKRDGTKKAEFAGEPAGIAVSPDGSRIAVILHDRRILSFDGNLKQIDSIKVKTKVFEIVFLTSGDLLALTSVGILRIGTGGQMSRTAYRGKAVDISVDKNEKLCAVSSYLSDGLICNQKPSDQFGFQMLALPKLKLVRSIQIRAHQLIFATLSSDARFVAFQARECGKSRSFIAVCETKTGREIARRISRGFEKLAFIPGTSVLAMTTSGYTNSEPVMLWKFPAGAQAGTGPAVLQK